MKNILVTGANGFVGRPLCHKLHADGYAVLQIIRSGPIGEQIAIGDIGADHDWSNILKGVDCVIHLAARVHMMKENSQDPIEEYRRVNVNGTLNLARHAALAGVKRFVYVSSVKVFGEKTNPGCCFSADDIPNPSDPYAISKYEAERGLFGIARDSDLEVVVVRPPLIYGPGVKANFYNLIRLVDKGIPLPLGGINNRRSMVSISNLIDFICACCFSKDGKGQVFCVSDGRDVSTSELIGLIARSLRKKVFLLNSKLMMIEFLLRVFGKESVGERVFGSLQVDIQKNKTVLGWAPIKSIEESIQETIDDYLKNKPSKG